MKTGQTPMVNLRNRIRSWQFRHVSFPPTSKFRVAPIRALGSRNCKSGQYFSVTTGVDNALTGLGNQTPNPVPGVSPYASVKTIDHWLNPAAFASPMTGTYGAVGLNTLQGPSIFQLDMAVSRTFTVAEKKTLQLRGEAFNLSIGTAYARERRASCRRCPGPFPAR